VTISTTPKPTGHRPPFRSVACGVTGSALATLTLRRCCRSTSRR